MRHDTITLRADTAGLVALISTGVIGALIVLTVAYLPPAVDWNNTYQPAARALIQAESPYAADVGFYNPPWALLPLSPFVAARDTGRGAVLLVAVLALAWVVVRQGASPLAMGLFLLSPPVLHSLLHGNVEWLVLLGVVLPPRWGLFFISIKPQVAGGVAVFWVVEAWRDAGWHGVVWLVGPFVATLAGSLVVFGCWPLRARTMPDLWWNASLWSMGPLAAVRSVEVGVLLLAWSLITRSPRPALAASPFLSPYVLLHAWMGVLVAAVHRPTVLIALITALWIATLL